jgi:threonine/homoserine/homoserine lactone efflux protein
MLTYWLRGLLIGLSIAAPVGPIGVLCIRRTLSSGRLVGFVSGLGAASADATYGAVAAFGLTAISSLLIGARPWIHLLGGVFLCYLGARTFLSAPAERAARTDGRGLPGAYASTLGLTLTNPATILSFAAIFAGLGIAQGSGYGPAAWLVLGVFIGSASWWLLLSNAIGLLRARIGPRQLRWVNRVSGVILLAFGLVALATGLPR